MRLGRVSSPRPDGDAFAVPGVPAAVLILGLDQAGDLGHSWLSPFSASGRWADRSAQASGPGFSARAAAVPSRFSPPCVGAGQKHRQSCDHSQQGTSRYTVFGTQRVTV